jgi:hypothetical protein
LVVSTIDPLPFTVDNLLSGIPAFVSFCSLPLAIAVTHLYPPEEPFGTSVRQKVGRVAPWFGWVLDRTVFQAQAKAEADIRAMCAVIPEHPESLNFLDAVAAGIARAVATGRVVVFGQADGMLSPLRSFGYPGPLEYLFMESGSLADALQREVSTGQYGLDWTVTSDEQLKLCAMHIGLHTPLSSGGALIGFFALGDSPGRHYSAAEKRLLAPLAQRTAAALANLAIHV